MVITTIILLKEKALYVFQVPMPLFLGDLQWISSRFAADILWGLLSKYHFKTLTHTARCYFFQRAISGFSCLSNLGASINIFHSCPLEIFYTSSNKLKLISCILTFPSVPNKLIKKKKKHPATHSSCLVNLNCERHCTIRCIENLTIISQVIYTDAYSHFGSNIDHQVSSVPNFWSRLYRTSYFGRTYRNTE